MMPRTVWLKGGRGYPTKGAGLKWNQCPFKPTIRWIMSCSWGAPGCSWVLLGVPACSWMLLGAPGVLLGAPGCSWVLLGAPGVLLGAPGCSRVPLGLGPSVRLLKEITRRATIKPHCSRIRRLRMMVFKNGPYLTCTPSYKLRTTVANDTFSGRFNDGLGWVSVSGILWKGKGSRTFGPPTKGDHPVC